MGKYVDRKRKNAIVKELFGTGFDENTNDYISQLLRGLSTVSAQQSNRASERASYADLPESARASMQSGIDYNTLLQGQEGMINLQRIRDRARREGGKFLLNLQESRNASKRSANAAKWQAIGQGTGQAVGTAIGTAVALSSRRFKKNIRPW